MWIQKMSKVSQLREHKFIVWVVLQYKKSGQCVPIHFVMIKLQRWFQKMKFGNKDAKISLE